MGNEAIDSPEKQNVSNSWDSASLTDEMLKPDALLGCSSGQAKQQLTPIKRYDVVIEILEQYITGKYQNQPSCRVF